MPFQESPAKMPGWTLLRNPDTKSVKYRSPDGYEVGPWAYKTSVKQYERTGIVPTSPVGTRWQAYQKNGNVSSRDSSANSITDAHIDIPIDDDNIQLSIPVEPKNTPASRKSGLFTSRELSDGFQTVFVIVTSMIAMASQVPEAQMNDMELKAISIPLGNIIERSKYNRTVGNMIVGKSDYLTLGYASFLYLHRTGEAIGERRKHGKSTSNTSQAAWQQGNNGNGNSAGNGPVVPLRVAPSGLRGYTGAN